MRDPRDATRIAPLGTADLHAYKALRDATLEADPDAFTSDAETERRKEAAEYLQRFGIGRTDGGQFVLGAHDAGGALIGAIGCERDRRVKVRHIGHLIGMMVRADRRGRGIGALLLDAAIAEAARAPGLGLLTLSVTDGNAAAIGLYASRGFVVYGRLDDAIRVGPRSLAKVLMRRPLRVGRAWLRARMPSAIVEIRTTYTPDEERRLLEAVHGAIVEGFAVSPVHRNVVLHVHPPHRFLGRTDCPEPEKLTNVSIFVLPGRSLEAKRRLYRLLVEALGGFGIPPRCVLVRLHELPPENFGVRGGFPVCDVELGYPVDI